MTGNDVAMNEAVFAALCGCLGIAPGSDMANALIHKAYLEPENSPQPPRNRDVIYYWIERDPETDDDGQSFLTDQNGAWSHELSSLKIRSYLAYKLIVVCYGPRAEDHAHRIRALLFLDGVRKPRGILRAAGIYPVPRPAEPALIREPAGSLWRKRADLIVRLRVKDEIETSQQMVTDGPEVKIIRGDLANAEY